MGLQTIHPRPGCGIYLPVMGVREFPLPQTSKSNRRIANMDHEKTKGEEEVQAGTGGNADAEPAINV